MAAAPECMPHKLALYIRADMDATVTQHTALHVNAQVRMRMIDKRCVFRINNLTLCNNAVLLQQTMKRFAGICGHGVGRVMVRYPCEQHTPFIFEFRRVRSDNHVIGHWCIACGHRFFRTVHLHQAQPAATDGLEPFVVAQCWHIEPNIMQRMKNADPAGDSMSVIIDCNRGHG